jgi:hypothetical protein
MLRSRAVQTLASAMILASCATTGAQRTPTVSIDQYALVEGHSEQSNEGVAISIDVINPAAVYEHPELFSFHSSEFGESGRALELYFPKGPMNRSWAYPFASEKGQYQILTAAVEVTNNTEHTIRLEDAQVVLALDGGRDLMAIDSWDDLCTHAAYFEELDRVQFKEELGVMRAVMPEFPRGFYPQLLNRNAEGWRMLNLDRGILPGRTAKGVLAFRVPTPLPGNATISLFDVTVQTDAAGTPTKRTQFHFPVFVEHAAFWYDRAAGRWRAGQAPATE